MKYGVTRKVSIHGLDNHEEDEIIARPGDNLQATLWVSKNLSGIPEEVEGILGNYAWAYFAMKREGLLEKYELQDKPTTDGLMEMADKVTLYFEEVPEGSLPLAGARRKTK